MPDPGIDIATTPVLLRPTVDRVRALRRDVAADAVTEQLALVAVADPSTMRNEVAEVMDTWTRRPTPTIAVGLDQVMRRHRVPTPARLHAVFTGAYLLGEAGLDDRLAAGVIVDPGESAKPVIDRLLARYQGHRQAGADTRGLATELDEQLDLVTGPDRTLVDQRRAAIDARPNGLYPMLWPDHLDRDRVATDLDVYLELLGDAPASAHGGPGEAGRRRRAVEAAMRDGVGLADIERVALRLVLADIDAGRRELPRLLFADLHSARAGSADRIAANAAEFVQRRDRDLRTAMRKEGLTAEQMSACNHELACLRMQHGELAVGRSSHPSERPYDRLLETRLTRLGIDADSRDRLLTRVADTLSDAAALGEHARFADHRWARLTGDAATHRPPEPASTAEADRGVDQNVAALYTVAQLVKAALPHAARPATAAPATTAGLAPPSRALAPTPELAAEF